VGRKGKALLLRIKDGGNNAVRELGLKAKTTGGGGKDEPSFTTKEKKAPRGPKRGRTNTSALGPVKNGVFEPAGSTLSKNEITSVRSRKSRSRAADKKTTKTKKGGGTQRKSRGEDERGERHGGSEKTQHRINGP